MKITDTYRITHNDKGVNKLVQFLNENDINLDAKSESILFDTIVECNTLEYFTVLCEFDDEYSYTHDENRYEIFIVVAIDTDSYEIDLTGYAYQDIVNTRYEKED